MLPVQESVDRFGNAEHVEARNREREESEGGGERAPLVVGVAPDPSAVPPCEREVDVPTRCELLPLRGSEQLSDQLLGVVRRQHRRVGFERLQLAVSANTRLAAAAEQQI